MQDSPFHYSFITQPQHAAESRTMWRVDTDRNLAWKVPLFFLPTSLSEEMLSLSIAHNVGSISRHYALTSQIQSNCRIFLSAPVTLEKDRHKPIFPYESFWRNIKFMLCLWHVYDMFNDSADNKGQQSGFTVTPKTNEKQTNKKNTKRTRASFLTHYFPTQPHWTPLALIGTLTAPQTHSPNISIWLH